MKSVRTYYWHDRVKGRFKLFIRRHILNRPEAWREFGMGNAGDIFARNLIAHFYPGATAVNVLDGPRLLCIGSIVHTACPGDVLCGVGSKGSDLPAIDPASVLVHSLRGPITEDELRKAGYDTSTLQWYGDPGLAISRLLPPRSAETGRVIFIPHYRERRQAGRSLPKGVHMVDIDSDPLDVGREIQRAELVYSSSLHGIIFAHALGRPVVMVKPATQEPLSKFEDYHLGVGLPKPTVLDTIAQADFRSAPSSPASLSVTADDIVFPETNILRTRGILS